MSILHNKYVAKKEREKTFLETTGSDRNTETLISRQITVNKLCVVNKNLCSHGVFWALPTLGTKHRSFRFVHCLILVSYSLNSGPSHPPRTLEEVLSGPVMHECISAPGGDSYAPQEDQPEPAHTCWKVLSALKGPLINRRNISQTPYLLLRHMQAPSVSHQARAPC